MQMVPLLPNRLVLMVEALEENVAAKAVAEGEITMSARAVQSRSIWGCGFH